MKVCLDVRYRLESGASSYIKNVVPAMMRLDPSCAFYLLKYAEQRFDFEDAAAGTIVLPGGSDLYHLAWTSVALPRIIRAHGIDIYHAMKMPGPSWTGARTVTTMHSIFDSYQGTFPVDLRTRLFLTFYGTPMLARSDRVIAVSGFVRDCLIERHRIDPALVDVAYNGIDDRFSRRDPAEVEAYKRERSLPDLYVLCVGNIAPVKNHLTAVRAFAAAGLPDDVHLLIAGSDRTTYANKVVEEAEALGISPRVRRLGFVSRTDLPLLMSGARLLLFPSLTEGCPVTMLEAFACGLPVLASNRGGLWELGRDIAHFVDDPLDATGFAAQLTRLWHDDEALRLAAAAGIAAAKRYTWEDSAREHLRCYEKVLASPN